MTSRPPTSLLTAPAHWSLVIGHWSLVIGHWSLVIGHWSLVIRANSARPPPNLRSQTPPP
ncbi:hypothetical protein CMV30_10715 [Nibricoccus aquaticus]|uniref:Uncharacterized protein n=1 Tax=Nibricoccus aquaticus TaxID=2576891 RepID=A0A290QCB4_9BACT|nr:hypothetical protein CMV30_10715 [Nibricoccus aquaticus]